MGILNRFFIKRKTGSLVDEIQETIHLMIKDNREAYVQPMPEGFSEEFTIGMIDLFKLNDNFTKFLTKAVEIIENFSETSRKSDNVDGMKICFEIAKTVDSVSKSGFATDTFIKLGIAVEDAARKEVIKDKDFQNFLKNTSLRKGVSDNSLLVSRVKQTIGVLIDQLLYYGITDRRFKLDSSSFEIGGKKYIFSLNASGFELSLSGKKVVILSRDQLISIRDLISGKSMSDGRRIAEERAWSYAQVSLNKAELI